MDELEENDRLLLEVAEDFAVLASGALGMTQAKHESGPLTTLRSDGVRKSLAALLSFQDANSGLSVRLNYLTTAEAGKEAGSALPDGAGGIAYWRLVARGADLEPWRELLPATQIEHPVRAFSRGAEEAPS